MWRAEGLQKSGKTLVFSAIAAVFGVGCDYNVYTNMKSLKWTPPGAKKPQPWAMTITLDDLFREMALTDKRKWKIKDGFLLIDEAPTWFLKGGQSTSNVSQMIARCSTQLLKHNIKLIYTAHLLHMVPFYLDSLTELVFECTTDDGGRHIAFRVYDNQYRIMCQHRGIPWGDWNKSQWSVIGNPFFQIYDYEEPMDIFATDMSDFAGASGRRRRRMLAPEEERQAAAPRVPVTNIYLPEGYQPASKADRIAEEVGVR